jgi:hypothetical protein
LDACRREVVVEAVERRRPMAPIRLEPLVDLAERAGLEPVQALLPVRARDDHPGLPQDAEMLGDSRLADAEVRHQLANGGFPIPQNVEDLAAMWLCENGERDVHGRYITIAACNCQGIHCRARIARA